MIIIMTMFIIIHTVYILYNNVTNTPAGSSYVVCCSCSCQAYKCTVTGTPDAWLNACGLTPQGPSTWASHEGVICSLIGWVAEKVGPNTGQGGLDFYKAGSCVEAGEAVSDGWSSALVPAHQTYVGNYCGGDAAPQRHLLHLVSFDFSIWWRVAMRHIFWHANLTTFLIILVFAGWRATCSSPDQRWVADWTIHSVSCSNDFLSFKVINFLVSAIT